MRKCTHYNIDRDSDSASWTCRLGLKLPLSWGPVIVNMLNQCLASGHGLVRPQHEPRFFSFFKWAKVLIFEEKHGKPAYEKKHPHAHHDQRPFRLCQVMWNFVTRRCRRHRPGAVAGNARQTKEVVSSYPK